MEKPATTGAKTYEYKVVPAPRKGLRAKGAKGSEARFAAALMAVMNEMGAQGWRYLRSDTLPLEERHGLRGKTTSHQNMLVFYRSLPGAHDARQTAPTQAAPAKEPARPASRETMPQPGSQDAPPAPSAAVQSHPPAGAAPVLAPSRQAMGNAPPLRSTAQGPDTAAPAPKAPDVTPR